MELRQLRHFISLADDMHFGRAAERLCISQPALSTSIRRLEEECGVRLFERDSKSVRITSAGDKMLRYARETVSQAERTKRYAQALASGQVGQLEMGYSGTLLSPELDDLMRQLPILLPEINIYMREMTSMRQLEQLALGRLDVGLVSLARPAPELNHISLYQDRVVACLPEDHPLAHRGVIDIAELRAETFILITRNRSAVRHDEILSLCAGAGFQPRVGFEVDHLLSLATLVSRGFGVALGPISLAKAGIAGIAFVELERSAPPRHWHFVWSAQRQVPGLLALVEHMRGFAAALPSDKND